MEVAVLTTDSAGEVIDNAIFGTFPGPRSPAIVVRDAAGDQAQVAIGLSGPPDAPPWPVVLRPPRAWSG
jgi:hypothetical protein